MLHLEFSNLIAGILQFNFPELDKSIIHKLKKSIVLFLFFIYISSFEFQYIFILQWLPLVQMIRFSLLILL